MFRLNAAQTARNHNPSSRVGLGGRGLVLEHYMHCQKRRATPLRMGGGRMLLGLNALMAGNIMSGSSACPLRRAASVMPPPAPWLGRRV